ncbi:MAG: hypothetical protein JNM76_07795 [Betaproteobacteria bacterium]|nr:hypothetical protein [Betaproteobacteria bacterium]
MRIFAVVMGLGVVASGARAETPPSFSLWETVSKIERYGPRDREPKVERRVEKQCLGPKQRNAEDMLKFEDMVKRLSTQCWVSDKREAEGRSQIKWTCKDGTTAEIATRQPAPNRLGYQVVFNIPRQGALSITAESLRIADTCEPPASPPPSQPAPPASPPPPGK